MIETEEIQFEYCTFATNIADIFSKELSIKHIKALQGHLSMSFIVEWNINKLN
jgi:hypothetical protein